MPNNLLDEITKVINSSIGLNNDPSTINEDFQLAGNILDSMSVTNLILAIEDHFGFIFSDEDLSAEAFETIGSLIHLIKSKMSQ